VTQEPSGTTLAAQKDRWPILVPVWVAVLGLFLTVYQGCVNGQLEKDKAQASLILKAIETGNVKDSATNLRFLIEAGLLEDPSGKITALLNKPGDVPKLPGSHSVESTLPEIVEITGTDSVELLCQDSANPEAAIRLGIDKDQLPATQGRARLPGLTSGSHSLWWSVDTPSATRTCEVIVNGAVRYRYQVASSNGALLLQVR